MANTSYVYSARYGPSYISVNGPSSTSTVPANLALRPAYTYKTTGSAFFSPIAFQDTGNITECWVKVIGYSGSWASTDRKINIELRNGLSGSNRPGATLTNAFTMSLNGTTTGWIKQTGLSVPVTGSKFYSVVVTDYDSTSANYVTLGYRFSNPGSTAIPPGGFAGTIYTLDGYKTVGTNVGDAPGIVLKQNGVYYSGCVFTSITTTTTGVYERGLRFKVPIPLTLIGYNVIGDNTSPWGTGSIRLYDDNTLPGGTPLMKFNLNAANLLAGTSPMPGICPFASTLHYTLNSNTWYRFVIKPGQSATTPRKAIMSGNTPSELLTAVMPFNGNCYATEDSGGQWLNQSSSLYLIYPILVPPSLTKTSTFIG